MKIPAFLPHSTRFVPFSTSTSRPSTFSFTNGMSRPSMMRAVRERAALLLDVAKELVLELLREAPGRPRGRVAQSADRVPLDIVGNREDDAEIARGPIARLDLPEESLQPAGPLAARRALPARLVGEEAGRDPGRAHHANRVVHHHGGTRAEQRSRARQ